MEPREMVIEKFEMYVQLQDCQCRFNRACDQILLLNTRLQCLRKRYKSARFNDCKSFRFPLRMRILVTEGLVKTYYHYADMKRGEIQSIRNILLKMEYFAEELAVINDDEL